MLCQLFLFFFIFLFDSYSVLYSAMSHSTFSINIGLVLVKAFIVIDITYYREISCSWYNFISFAVALRIIGNFFSSLFRLFAFYFFLFYFVVYCCYCLVTVCIDFVVVTEFSLISRFFSSSTSIYLYLYSYPVKGLWSDHYHCMHCNLVIYALAQDWPRTVWVFRF